MTTLEKTQLSMNIAGVLGAGISTAPLPVESLLSAGARNPPAPANGSKFPEGWHNTEKYGEVFVSPGGIAWVVQQIGDELASVAVKIEKEDIVLKPSAERTKHARYVKEWFKSKAGK